MSIPDRQTQNTPPLSLPKGGDAIRGIGEKFTTNPTGTGAMTVPITTSLGRANFGPKLALSYDLGAGNGSQKNMMPEICSLNLIRARYDGRRNCEEQ